MRRAFLFLFIVLFTTPAFSEITADTTILIRGVEVLGTRFAGLSERNGVKLLRVEDNLSSAATTTTDALRQMPSLITDMEGGVTYRGSNQPGMLINGVPYGLLEEYSGDVLIQLPALFFDRLSVFQYPAIQMIPDGDAGVINLSSRLYTADEAPLILTLGGGWNERYNVGGILNVHPGKFHITGKYNYRREYRERSFSKSTTTSKNRTEMNNNASARPDVHIADLMIGYDLSSKDQLMVHGLYHLMDYSRYGRINNQVFNLKGEQMKHVIRNRYNNQRQTAYGAEAYWNRTIAEDKSLFAVFNYNNFLYGEDNEFKNENPQNGKIVAEDNQFINQSKHNYYWSIGYSQQFAGDLSLNVGYIGRAKTEDYNTDVANKVDGMWKPDPAKTHGYTFHRYLNVLYGSLEKTWDRFSAEMGVQAELNKQEMGERLNTRFHLYPRMRLGYGWDKYNRFDLSYQQRVIRPTGANLSSFVDASDATHVWQGNPDLKDEFIHIVELGYRFTAPRFRLTPAMYFRNRTNRIMEIATQVEDQTIWKKENIGYSRSAGIDLSGSWNPLRILTIGFSGNVYRDEIDGRKIGYGEKKSLACWDVKGNVNVSVTPTTDLQVDGFYISDQLTPQGKIESHYSINAGLSQYFLHRKLCANLSVNNIFNSMEEVTIIDMPDLRMTQKRNRDACVAWLTLTYSL